MDAFSIKGLSTAEITEYLAGYANTSIDVYNDIVHGDLNTQIENFNKANGSLLEKILGVTSLEDLNSNVEKVANSAREMSNNSLEDNKQLLAGNEKMNELVVHSEIPYRSWI